MPDSRPSGSREPDSREKHRGPHPKDPDLFGQQARQRLAKAGRDYRWLLSREYPEDASLKLVGDRFDLTARQRLAVRRATCSRAQRRQRQLKAVPPKQIRGETLAIDAFNVLTTVEAAFSGGVLLECQDGCYRDMASMHGTYRRVAETIPAIECTGRYLAQLGPAHCLWLIDQPVSNSGRLRSMLQDTAQKYSWPWTVQLVPDPDPLLCRSEHVVCTADSMILDQCRRWLNLTALLLAAERAPWWLVRFD